MAEMRPVNDVEKLLEGGRDPIEAVKIAAVIAGIYFLIAEEVLGEEEVRKRFNARFEEITQGKGPMVKHREED
jgi:hypothetical protein